MDGFINFFKSGQVGDTNLTDVFTKTIPKGFESIGFPPLPPLKKISIPPPPTINIDRGTKDFFTTGRTVALDKSNKAIAGAFSKSNNDIAVALNKSNNAIAEAFTAPINPDVKKFFEKDVKNVVTNVAGTLEKMITAPSKLMSSLTDSLNNPILLPAILVIGGIVVFKIATK